MTNINSLPFHLNPSKEKNNGSTGLHICTTLRDGEQVPLQISKRARPGPETGALGVDIIEAGFPISSPVILNR